jgi:hypothetical protein
MEDVRGATNIGDQTKEGVKSLTKKVKGVADSAVEGAKSAAGSNLINLLGKSLAIGAIGYGLANRDRLSAIPSAIGIGAPVLGGLLSLGNFLSKRRK